MSDPVRFQFPEKLGFLFHPARYKVAYGGRDAAKSWSFARALLLLGAEQPMRIGCFREVQKSIKDSVHKLLSDQVEVLGLGNFYRVLQTELRGGNGTEFTFSGLSNETRDSIKSYEGLDIAWVEEAQTVVKRSWDILIPTIRKPGSEIWVSFNPLMDTDDTYQRFVVDPPPEAKVVKINWYDNPWRSTVLDAERDRMKIVAPEDYAHIYEGHCRPAVEGAIYYNEVSAVKSSNRLCNVPYDPLLKVHAVYDLGFNDYMAILLVQRHASEIRIIRYIEDRQRTLVDYDNELKGYGYNFGTFFLPHDGRAKDYKSGKSAQEILQQLGRRVEIIEDIGVEDGIRAARLVFPRCYFDKANASELLTRLGRYRRRVNKETGTATTPMHDDDSHGADGFRYLAIVADQMSNDTMTIPNINKAFRFA